MKAIFAAAAFALALPLAACGGSGDDKLADRVEDTAENKADMLEARADNLEDQAEAVREIGGDRAEAIDDADVDADAMTNGQKAAVINGAAEVR